MLQTDLIGKSLIWFCGNNENVIVRAAWIHGACLRLLIEKTDGRLIEVKAENCKVRKRTDLK